VTSSPTSSQTTSMTTSQTTTLVSAQYNSSLLLCCICCVESYTLYHAYAKCLVLCDCLLHCRCIQGSNASHCCIHTVYLLTLVYMLLIHLFFSARNPSFGTLLVWCACIFYVRAPSTEYVLACDQCADKLANYLTDDYSYYHYY
jgi:hypothetical protein